MSQSKFVNEAVAGWSHLLPDQDMTGLEAIQRLVWSGRLAHRIMEQAAVAAGFRRRGDYEVLSLLRRNEPALLSPAEVAQELLSSPSGMTGKLDRLEEQGLIQRTPDPQDRRAVRLRVTDAGRAMIDAAFVASLHAYDSMLDGLTRTEADDIATLLGKVLRRLDHLARQHEPGYRSEAAGD